MSERNEELRLQLACDKLGHLLSAHYRRATASVSDVTTGAWRTFTWDGGEAPAAGSTDPRICKLQWLLPVAKWKRWTLTDSAAYRAVQIKSAVRNSEACAGLYIVVVHDHMEITTEVTNAGYRDQIRKESGELFLLPRVLPISCKTIMNLDQGRAMQLQHPRLIAATVVNEIMGIAPGEPPEASLVSQIKADDPALLWEVLQVRIGSMLHVPPHSFYLVVPC